MSSNLPNRTGWSLKASVLAIASLILTVSDATGGATDPIDISQIVQDNGVEAAASTVMVQRLSDGQVWVSNAERSEERFSPASSSKIPHTLIALETGVAAPDTVFKWDGKSRWVDAWNRDQTLTSAFQVSAVWVYQDIVQRVGAAGMAEWLDRFDYGNANIGTEATLTTYWLQDILLVSAVEQVNFLHRLVERDLSLSDTTYAAADAIMQTDAGDGWTMYSKTGWRHGADIMDIGWYAGWGRCGSDTYVFALNMDMPDASFRQLRITTSTAVLEAIGAFDCQ
ncbi:class D beta-lactamase [Synechococcus sp. MU1644]|nr:class D beta-lactamase [Synechococcus sp. MU1644]